jgi:hypothetical protein
MSPLDDTRVLPERFEDLEPAERLRVLKAGSAMTHFVFGRAVAVLLSAPIGQSGYLRSGSAFVLRLLDHDYLGTAWHVVKEWHDATSTGNKIVFQVGAVSLNPIDRLAWKDEQNDIAFLRLISGEAQRVGVQPSEPLFGWPPPHPESGSYLLLSGYPGIERRRPADDEFDFGAFSTMLQVTASHENYIVCQFQREHWISEGRDVPPPGTDLGGMSGGPALLVKNLAYPLIGLISEFSRDYELLYVKTLSHVPRVLG